MLISLYLLRAAVRRRDVEFVLAVMFAIAILEGVLALVLGNTVRDTTFGPLHVAVVGDGRFSGTFGHPNSAGAYFEIVLMPAIAMAVAPVRASLRRLAAFAAAFSAIGLALTSSRGAWIAVAVSGAIFAVVGVRRKWFAARAPVALAVCAMALLAPFAGSIATRLTESDEGTAYSRVELARLAERIIRDHPIFGIGSNNYAVVMQSYRTPDVSGTWDYIVHDKYLLVWSETGAVGLLAFVAILAIALRAGSRAARSPDRAIAMISVGLSAALVGSMVHMLVDTFQSRAEVTNLFIVTALLVALCGMARAGSAESAKLQ